MFGKKNIQGNTKALKHSRDILIVVENLRNNSTYEFIS